MVVLDVKEVLTPHEGKKLKYLQREA